MSTKDRVLEALVADPNFSLTGPILFPSVQAELILAGRGDCAQCSGYGCIHCHFTGEESNLGSASEAYLITPA